MTKRKAVIFDMDGLMIDSEQLGLRIYLREAQDMGLTMTEEIYRKLLGTDTENVRRILCGYFPAEKVAQLVPRVEEAKKQHYLTGEIPVKKGVYALFDYLEEKGIKRIIATSSPRARTAIVLEKIGLKHRLDGGAYGDEVQHAKPNPEIFLNALKTAGTAPEETIILEDSYNGIRAANNAGIDVIMIPDMLPPLAELPPLAVLDDLTQVIDFLEGENG